MNEPLPPMAALIENTASWVIGTILKQDSKVTSYKLAFVRALNDVVLSCPDARLITNTSQFLLPILAEYWLVYYWPFAGPRVPVFQGPPAQRTGALVTWRSARRLRDFGRLVMQSSEARLVRPTASS
jgi:hypothetical protein